MPTDSARQGEGPFKFPALAALQLSGAFTAMAIVTVSVLLPGLQHEFAAVPYVNLLVQLAGALTPTCLALSAPFIGRLVDQIGYRPVYLTGLVAFAVFGALPAALHNLYLILLCRAALGVSTAAVLIAALGGIAVLPPARRARLLGFQTFIGGVATIIIFAVVGAIAQHGWRAAFLIHLLAVLVIPLALTLPKLANAHAPSEITGGAAGAGNILSPGLIGSAILIGMIMFISGMYGSLFLPTIGISKPALLALPPILGAALGMALSASFGWIHARFSIASIFTLSLGMCAFGLLACGVAASYGLYLVGAALQGAGSTLFTPAVTAAAIARAGEARAGRAVGLAQGALFCSQVVFPFISTPLAHVAGIRAIYFTFGAAALIATLGYLAARRSPKWRADDRMGASAASPHGP